jgi:hypothetical protein
MPGRRRRLLLSKAAALLGLVGALSEPVRALPLDLVPRGDWSYDVLADIARRGLLPGVSARSLHGDELRTRAQIAGLISQAVERADALPPGVRVALSHLVLEYRPELGERMATLHETLSPADKGGFGGGYVLGRVVTNGDTSANLIYRGDGAFSLNRYLTGTAAVTNERRLWSELPSAFTELGRLTARLETRLVTWELGKRDEYWGPGYGGAMLVSDNAPGFSNLRGEATLKLGSFGNWQLVQNIGTFSESGGRKYVVSRRLSSQIGRRFELSLGEAVKTNTSKQLYLAYILPLYLYGKILDEDVPESTTLNYLANVSMGYKAGRWIDIYGDLVLDDVSAPFGLGEGDVGRKIGYLLGVTIRPVAGSDRTDIRLEYALVDGDDPGFAAEGGTYWHRNPDLAWYHDGLTMGHRMSRNRRGPFARVRHQFNEQFTAIAAWEGWDQYRATPVVGDRRLLTLYLAYDPKPDRSLALRIDDPGGVLGNDPLFQIQAAYSF